MWRMLVREVFPEPCANSRQEEVFHSIVESQVTLPCQLLSTIPFHARAPTSRPAARSPLRPWRCCPPAPHPTRAPAATLFVRGRAGRARVLLRALARVSSRRPFPGALSNAAPRALPARPPEKSLVPRVEKPR